MLNLSVVVITLNEEKNLARCLQSVKDIADEIVVVDSFSTDNTVAIAESFGAKVIQQKFLGHLEQKNFATEHATYDWVFSIDADEELTPEVRESILKVKHHPACNAYRVNRRTNYCGKWINHSGWYPDTKIRLYNRLKGMWKGENPHDRWELHDVHGSTGKLKGDLLHYSFYTIADHARKIERYSEIAARQRVAKGKNYSILQIWFVPKWEFFSTYILRLGILDGYEGYIICRLLAYEKLLKYSKTRQYRHMELAGK